MGLLLQSAGCGNRKRKGTLPDAAAPQEEGNADLQVYNQGLRTDAAAIVEAAARMIMGGRMREALQMMDNAQVPLDALAGSMTREFAVVFMDLRNMLAIMESGGTNEESRSRYVFAQSLQAAASDLFEESEGADLMVNVGLLYMSIGASHDARDIFARALRIKEAHYGPDHAEVAITLTNLGSAHGALGDARTKREMLERALRIFEAHYGPDHAHVAFVQAELNHMQRAGGT